MLLDEFIKLSVCNLFIIWNKIKKSLSISVTIIMNEFFSRFAEVNRVGVCISCKIDNEIDMKIVF